MAFACLSAKVGCPVPSCRVLRDPGVPSGWLWAGPSVRCGPVSVMLSTSGSSESRGRCRATWGSPLPSALPALPACPLGWGQRSEPSLDGALCPYPWTPRLVSHLTRSLLSFSRRGDAGVLRGADLRGPGCAHLRAARAWRARGEGLTAVSGGGGGGLGQLTPHCFPGQGQGWGPLGRWFRFERVLF